MASARTIVVDHSASGHLKLASAEVQQPGPSDALVRVAAFSLNRGEVRRSAAAPDGFRPGWDLAGVVEQPAKDGSGPPAGARVVGVLPAGAWSEIVPVPVSSLAVLPEEVSFTEAATLPVAGLTALNALDRAGSILQRRVLITGASGGVGYYAVQLAALSGAIVTGAVRDPNRTDLVRAAGASNVAAGEDLEPARQFGPFRHIVDSLGGKPLGQAATMLEPDGACVFFGVTAGASTTLDVGSFYPNGGNSLYGLYLFYELKRQPAGAGLTRLIELLAAGKLKTLVEVEAPWSDIGQIALKLQERAYAGKAVLHVG